MHGLRASGLCLLLASIAAFLLSDDGIRRIKSLVSGRTAPPVEGDVVWMLQAKWELELGLAKREAAKHRSADLAKVRTAIHNPNVTAVSSALVLNAEPEVLTTAESENSGGPQSYVRLILAPLEMLCTKAIRSWQSKGVVQISSFTVLLMVVLLVLGGLSAFFLSEVFAGRMGNRDETAHKTSPVNTSNGEIDKARRDRSLSASEVRSPLPPELSSPPCSERTSQLSLDDVPSTFHSERTSRKGQARFVVPMIPFSEALANGKSEEEIVILDRAGDACLNLIMTNMIGGARIEVSALQDVGKKSRYAIVGPPPNTSQTKSKTLVVHAKNDGTFNGTLEQQGDGYWTVIQEQKLVMYLRFAHDVHKLTVTTDHAELASVRHNAGGGLDIRVATDVDAVLVLACALAVAIRLFA